MTCDTNGCLPPNLAREAGSFRDPAGHVFRLNGRILRTVTTRAKSDYEFVRDSGCLAKFIDRGWVVDTVETDAQPFLAVEKDVCYVLEHEPVPWVSFPYEWGFSALKAAALLHLEIQLAALEHNVALSDASAYNIQFIGAQPIFIDVLSFRRRRDGELWTGQRQFIEQFLNPLLLRALAGVPHNFWYRGALDGIESQHLNSVIPLWKKFDWKILASVTLPSRIQQSARKRSTENIQDLKKKRLSKAGYSALLVSMRDWIATLKPKESGETVWENYEADRTYQSTDAVRKRDFISEFVRTTNPNMVWDLGCNTGEFSEAALAAGAGYVVGFDIDHGALDKAFARSRDSGLALQVVHQDGANPTPGQGWLMRERGSLTARGIPDAIFALAFEHHLAIGKNIPLDQVVCWLTSLAPTGIIEFVQKSDPTIQRMLAAREDIFDDYTEERFRGALESCAEITHEERITDDNRILFGFKTRPHA